MLEGAVQADTREGLLFGERIDGSLAHVSEVPSGLACDCRCPNCGTPLVARKGEQLVHHFGHHGAAGERACAGGPETALHRFAKELLAAKLAFVLPSLHGDGEGRARYAGGFHRFDAALLERRLGAIVPDVIVRRADRDLLVEFHVTHACDTTKIAKIASLGIAAVEVDLSGLAQNAPRAELEAAILERAPRQWLHNPKLGVGSGASGPTMSSITPESRPPSAALERAYTFAYREALSARSQGLAGRLIEADDLACAIGIEVAGLGCFTASPRDWQAIILLNALEGALVGRSSIVSAKASLQQLRERGWLRTRFGR
ncbi:competence protein CoiA family protein, partial [Methylorubrum extorquens]